MIGLAKNWDSNVINRGSGCLFTIDRAHVDRVTCNRTFLRRVYDLIIVHRRAILYASIRFPFYGAGRMMARRGFFGTFIRLIFFFIRKYSKYWSTIVWPILLSQFRTKRNVSKELIKGMDQLTRKTWDYKNMEKWFVHLLIVLLLQPCIPRYFNDISEVFQLRFDCISRIAHAPPDTAFHIEKEHASGMDLRTVWYAWYYAVFRFGLVLLPAHLHMRVLVSMDLLW